MQYGCRGATLPEYLAAVLVSRCGDFGVPRDREATYVCRAHSVAKCHYDTPEVPQSDKPEVSRVHEAQVLRAQSSAKQHFGTLEVSPAE